MCNLIAMMIMTQERGDSILCGDKCHILNYERGNLSAMGGIMPRVLPNDPINGNLDIDKIEALLPNFDDQHISQLRGLTIESSHQGCNGAVARTKYTKELKTICR